MSDTYEKILEAARRCLLDDGYAGLSTRRIAEVAGVGTGHLHYHFRSKQNLVLAVLERENERRLERQTDLFGEDTLLWKKWERACDFLDDDLESGYVRILQEMTAAGWSNPAIADAVRGFVRGWIDLLTEVAEVAAGRLGGFGPFAPDEMATLVADAFLGAETRLLLGVPDDVEPHRRALRRVGELIRELEED